MDILDALADDVSIREFFVDWAPRLFAARRDDFAAASAVDLVLCFKFEDTDEVYTLEMSRGGLVVEDDEMIDFPALTVVGLAKNWPRVRERLRPLAEQLERRREQVRDSFRVTQAFVDDWEKFDLVIDIEVTDGSPGGGIKFSVVLNDYNAPKGARRFGFTVPLQALDAMAGGRQSPEQVARGLKITGDVRVAATFGGMILSHN